MTPRNQTSLRPLAHLKNLLRTKATLACLSVVVFLCSAARLHCQDTHGTINGQVTDPSGRAVAGAAVQAVNSKTHTPVSGKSNGSGLYTIPFLDPGTYTISAEAPGFKKIQRENIELRVNDTLDVELHLELGEASESVTVTSAPPVLETESASQGEVVDTRRIEDLPLQAGNPAEMILFSPGVVNSTNLRARKTSFNSASSQFVSDGNQLYSNEYTIDGVPDTFASAGTPLVAFQPPQFAVNEFRVLTAGYDAAVGHASGAVVNLVTNSGTDHYHGEAHEFMSNSYLDSSTYFQLQANQRKPEYQDNRYGASIGGPLSIPHLLQDRKTFFFYSWEANKWGKPVTTVGTVPTDAEKNGNFSALLPAGCSSTNGQYVVDPNSGIAYCGTALPSLLSSGTVDSYQIYNPFSAVPASGGHVTRSGFAGNVIPSNLLDPVAKKILGYYAQPNTAGTSTGQNNYTQSIKDIFDYYVHFVRVDHVFSDRNRMFARFDYDHYLETDPGFYGNASGGINLVRINRGGALDDVIVLSPSNVLDVRYGFTQEEAPEHKISTGIDLGALGFSSSLLSLLNRSSETFPTIYLNTKPGTGSCTGACTGTYSGFGNFNNGDGTITGYIHQFAANLNSTRGSNDLHFGGDFRLYRSFGNQAPFDVTPSFQFLTTYTSASDTAPAAPLGQELAALELGLPSVSMMTRSASYASQDVYSGFFAQDNWKANHRLTLNLGLRIEHEGPVTERFNRSIRGFDTADVNPIAAQATANYAKSPSALLPVSRFQVLGGLQFASPSNRDLWEQPYLTSMPRFGFAYSLDDATVLRGGYGMFYDTIGINRSVVLQTGFTSVTQYSASPDNGLHFTSTLANPFPTGLLPPVSSGNGSLTTALGQAITYYPTERRQPYSQRASLGLQHTFANNFMMDISYVGNKALHLAVQNNINATPQQYLSTLPTRDTAVVKALGATVSNPFYGTSPGFTSKTITVADLLRPYPEFGDVTRIDSDGYSWYHSLQTRAEKRFSSGFTVNAAYTWSRFSEATSYLNPGDLRLNRSISQYDRPQRIVISGIWELPVGRGHRFLHDSNGAVDLLLGGWQLNTSFEQQSGSPLSFGDVILKPGGSISQIALDSGSRSVSHWFNTALFDTTSADQRQYDIRTFPKYISSVRGPNQSQLNGSAFKTFMLDRGLAFQVRVECYDILNHYNFSDPSTSPTSSSFGIITSQGSPSRQFQAALRLFF